MRGDQKLFSTVVVSAIAAALLFSEPTIVTADTTNLNAGETINLTTLIDNGLSVQIGDKVFGDFYWNDTSNSGAPDMAASNVNLRALSNLNDIGFRMEFQLPLTAGADENKDFLFEYTAAITNSSNLISDIHLSVTGDTGGFGFASLAETAYANGRGAGDVGQLDAFLGALFPPESATSATNLNYSVTKLWITKDVVVYGYDDHASISAIEQTFSQIPEPSTALLVGLGLLGVVAVNRQRKS